MPGKSAWHSLIIHMPHFLNAGKLSSLFYNHLNVIIRKVSIMAQQPE